MGEPQLVEEVTLLEQQHGNHKQAQQTLLQAEDKVREAEALLMVIDSALGELKQPLTVILGLSDLLLARMDQNDSTAADLRTIAEQVKRISEIIKGVDYLTRYNSTQSG
jgi:signal transduction histidine kinase